MKKKETTFGNLMEVNIYPQPHSASSVRNPKKGCSTDAQIRYNKKRARSNLLRFVHCNFTGNDSLFVHLTFKAEISPQTSGEMVNEFKKFMRRLRTRRNKEIKKSNKQINSLIHKKRKTQKEKDLLKTAADTIKVLQESLLYIYIIDATTHLKGKHKGKLHMHFHAFLSGVTEKLVKDAWGSLGIAKCSVFDPDRYGYDRAVNYISKASAGKKTYYPSHNLKEPDVAEDSIELSRNGIEKLARNRASLTNKLQSMYPSYTVIDVETTMNEITGELSIHATLKLK